MALLATLTDDFSGTTLDTTKWTVTANTNGSSYSVAGGALTLTTGTVNTSARVAIDSAATYDVLNSSVVAKVSFPTSTGSSHFRRLTVYDSTRTGNLVRIELRSGSLYATSAGGATSTSTTTTIGAYNATTHAYWRIRSTAAGAFYYGFSTDGTTWSDTAFANNGAFNSYSAVVAQLEAANNSTATAASMAVDTINPQPPTAAPASITDTETVGAPTITTASTLIPASVTDTDTLGTPTATYTYAVAPDSTTDGETLGAPSATVIGVGAYGTGLYGQGVYGGTGTPLPTGLTNYQYGQGVYGEGPYYGYVGAPSGTNPADNPTYGTGTYGYGIYYGLATTTQQCTPLFTDIAGTGRPPLHIIGIGPWSPVIHWRGAANYGVGAGNLPARPALPMPPASSKGFTLRLNEGCEARFELNLARGSGLIIDEMDTDVWWRRKDPRTGVVEIIGRFNVSHANTSTSDTGLNISLQCDDYRTILGQRMVLRYLHPTTAESMWDQGTPITDILKWAIPANMRLDLSELDSYDLGTITQPYTLPPGTTLAEVFEQLNALSPIRWEWWIETPNDINKAPKLRFQLGTRGLDKGVVLFDLGKGPSPIAAWTRNAAADNYANSIIYNGANGSVVKVIDAQVVQYGQRDTTAGNSSIDGTHIQLMRARAATKLAQLASRAPTYTINLAAGFWRGRSHIDVGDTITLILRLGEETLKEKHRVTEITVEIDSQGAEEVTLTLGTPLPSPDPRSKRSPLQRIVRHLHEYEAPPGSADVITDDQ